MREMPKGLPARVLVMTSEEANPLTKRIPFSTVNLADYLPISVRLSCPVVSLHPSTSLLVSNPSRTTSSGGSLSQAIKPIPVNDQPILLSSSCFNFAFQSDILKSSTSGIVSYIRLSTSVRQSLFLKSQMEYQREKNEPSIILVLVKKRKVANYRQCTYEKLNETGFWLKFKSI
ncbi:hypothetical protein AMTRI_Chr03g46520 [Amborella trichopoda]